MYINLSGQKDDAEKLRKLFKSIIYMPCMHKGQDAIFPKCLIVKLRHSMHYSYPTIPVLKYSQFTILHVHVNAP